jgi:hypothetical protein
VGVLGPIHTIHISHPPPFLLALPPCAGLL